MSKPGPYTEIEVILKRAIDNAIEELCKGRTFYEGYFEQANLSRTDKTCKILLDGLKEAGYNG